MMETDLRVLALIGYCLIASHSTAEQLSPQMIAMACRGCHISSSTQLMAVIEGQPKNLLINKLLDYKYGRINNTMMQRITLGYSDQELDALADYLSRQTLQP